ncbi:MBL fold metallo-hydrolase [Actinoplanes sp. NPDC051633]|uniref:MBL fold metallo-hydrolase n=1 Tax=Actinoplanes sp. NPDC051633 TaxID=3155670 RepID=UPI003419E5CF
MRITKHTHSCLRIEGDGVLVVDPGVFGERSDLSGADTVLITHEHPDHLDVGALAAAAAERPGMRVVAHPDVVPQLAEVDAEVTAVEPGAEFSAAGFTIRAYGGQHAIIHPDLPRIANIGFLVSDGRSNLFHPGDSFVVPADVQVQTLFVPFQAPWSKISEAIEYVRAVHPERAFAIHDALVKDFAAGIYDGHFDRLSGTRYAHVAPGTTID